MIQFKNPTLETNFAEALTDKFVNQVKKQRQQYKMEPTQLVKIELLPNTATREDINKLAREAFHKGDKNIVEVVFCRNSDFEFNGQSVIHMNSTEDARRLIEYADRRMLGGKILRANYIGNKKTSIESEIRKYRVSELKSITDPTCAAGRSVVISGLPPVLGELGVLSYLRKNKFSPIEGVRDNVIRLKRNKRNISKFLVKFDSESEAWRCVRTFHNTNFSFRNQNYKLQLTVAY